MSDDPLARLASEQESARGARVEFHAQLADLEGQLIHAAAQAAAAVNPVTAAFLAADHDAADGWALQYRQLSSQCRDLEEAGYVLLARQSPVAGDLRRIVTALRNAGDVQRTGNLLRHIAGSLQWLDPRDLPDRVRELVADFGTVASDIYHGAVQAWRDGDGLAAIDLQRQDDRADGLQRALLTELYDGHCPVEQVVTLALVARYYERIADHGVELARGVTYAVTGERLSAP